MRDTVCFILGGGRGAGLYPLTRMRSVPAVSVAGKYRLIDVPISNCINSGLTRIYVLTQFLSVSLHRHIANTYSFSPFSEGSVQVLAAQQTNESMGWYQGTADALRQNLRYIRDDRGSDVLIVSGDGLYRMNYGTLLEHHRRAGADLTIAAVRVPRSRASSYGILATSPDGRVLDLAEKPKDPAILGRMQLPGGDFLANMGVYACRRSFLLEALSGTPGHDLVTQHFLPALASGRVSAYEFKGFWHDLGSSIAAYHEVHLALATAKPPFDFGSDEGRIFTHMRNLPASRVQAAEVRESLVSDGCLIGPGSRVHSSVVGLRSRIGADVWLSESVVCGADRYEAAESKRYNQAAGLPDVGIGPGSVLKRVIADKDCRIGAGVKITNEAGVRHHDAENYCIRDGIVVVPKGAVIPDGTVI
jgi:glucose-1-phosphate adenylyltransferase